MCEKDKQPSKDALERAKGMGCCVVELIKLGVGRRESDGAVTVWPYMDEDGIKALAALLDNPPGKPEGATSRMQRCHSGHETITTIWNCPVCTDHKIDFYDRLEAAGVLEALEKLRGLPWRFGTACGAIISDSPTRWDGEPDEEANIRFYGGNVVCESIEESHAEALITVVNGLAKAVEGKS